MVNTNTLVQTYGLSQPVPYNYPNKVKTEITEQEKQIAKLVASKIWETIVDKNWFEFMVNEDEKYEFIINGNLPTTSQENLQNVVNSATLFDYVEIMKILGFDIERATDMCKIALFGAEPIIINNFGRLGCNDFESLQIKTQEWPSSSIIHSWFKDMAENSVRLDNSCFD